MYIRSGIYNIIEKIGELKKLIMDHKRINELSSRKVGEGMEGKNWLEFRLSFLNSKKYVKIGEKLSPLKFGEGKRGSIRNMKFSHNRVTEDTVGKILKKERKSSQELDLKEFKEWTLDKPSPLGNFLDEIETKSIESIDDLEEQEKQILKQSIILTQCESFQPLSKLEAFYFTQKRLNAKEFADCNKNSNSPTTTAHSRGCQTPFSQECLKKEEKFTSSHNNELSKNIF